MLKISTLTNFILNLVTTNLFFNPFEFQLFKTVKTKPNKKKCMETKMDKLESLVVTKWTLSLTQPHKTGS